LGNCYIKEKNISLGITMYQNAITRLTEAHDVDLFCEGAQNLSKAYLDKKQIDSSLLYAHISLNTATKAGFTYRIKDAVEFLSKFYKSMNRYDSALFYNEKMTDIKDSINSADKIKSFQLQSFNEEIRQAELFERKRKEEAERFQQLQLLIIGIFIPIFFLLTLLLSKRKIHIKAIKLLGIISLLLLFEYLTLLLHPIVVDFTHHTPVYEIIIFVTIAALLIPTHHRIENWLIQRLTIKHINTEDQALIIKTNKIKFKKPLQ
jgi:tetratricopeptide (TPR) repeat protein